MASIGALVIDLIAKTGSFETDIGRAAKTAEKRSKEIERSVSRLGSKIKVGLSGLLAGFSFAKVIEATSEAEKALGALDNAVKNNAGAAGTTTAQLVQFSSELQNLTTFSDESVQGMQALLLSFKQISGSEFQRAQTSILDLATALGKDLNSATILVGRALADPVKGMTALSRAGVVLGKDQQDLIKKLVSTGQSAKAQEVLLDELQKRYGGAAQAARNTFGGALTGLKNSFGDLLEAKGGLPGAISKINELSSLLADPKTKQAADSLLTGIISGAAALVPIIGNVVSGLRTLAGGATEIEKLQSKLDFLTRERESSIPVVFNFGYLNGASPILGPGALDKEIARIKAAIADAANPKVAQSTPSTRVRGRETMQAAPPSEEFTKAADKLREQIELYGKVGQAARISFEIQSGALEDLTKSEQDQLLALARQYDAIVASADATKKSAEAAVQAKKSLDDMLTTLQQQVVTFDQGETATIRYRLANGDLSDTMKDAGEGADEYASKIIHLTNQMEIMKDAADGAKDAIAEFAEINLDNLETDLAPILDEVEKKVGKAANNDKFAEQFKDGIFRSLEDGIYDGMTEGAKKGWKGLYDAGIQTINRLVAAALAKKLAEGLFGGATAGGASTGGGGQWAWVSKIAGLFGGGKAYGGGVTAGTMYRVNEREPEFFKPNVGGNVIPLSKMSKSGGGDTYNTFNVSGRMDGRTAKQLNVEQARRQRIDTQRLG